MSGKEAKWQVLDRATAQRKRLLDAGYRPIPTNGKVPVVDEWQNINATETAIDEWSRQYPGATNTGILTAYTPTVDIDVLDAGVAEELQVMLWLTTGGRSMLRTGQKPKCAVLFRTDRPFGKLTTPIFISPDQREHHVEVLCDGQQVVAYGVHPDTDTHYEWQFGEPCNIRHGELRPLSAEVAREYLDRCEECMKNHGWVERPKTNGNTATFGERIKANTANDFDRLYGEREQKYARAALDGCVAELASTAKGGRNNKLNAIAFRLGTMSVRKWIDDDEVIKALLGACEANGYIQENGHRAAMQTIESGLTAGWKEPHPDLKERDEGGNEAWRKNGGKGRSQTTEVSLAQADGIAQQPVNWIWPNRIARGKLTLIGGDPGVGKSQIEIDIIARCSTGAAWPDGGTAPIGSCVILSAEDAANDTICPRLDLAGANLAKVLILQGVTDSDGRRLSFNLQRDLAALAEAIKKVGDVVLVSIDPITSYMGDGIDSHRTTDVRGVLEKLDKFAEIENVAVLAVTHPPKATQSKAINAFTGSLAFVADARLAFIAIEEPETDRSLLLAVKNNLGPKADGLGFRLIQGLTSKNIQASRVAWDAEPVNMNANEALAASGTEGKRGVQRHEAEEFLLGYLEAGPMPADKVIEAADANDISERTLKRAKAKLKIITEKGGYQGEWQWRLPS